MNISLTPELEKLISLKVKSGMYGSASEVIRAGLRLLQEDSKSKNLEFLSLKKAVQAGLAQAARNEIVDGDEVFRELKERHRKRKAGK